MLAESHLIYTSRSVSRFTASELEELAGLSQQHNSSLDVTGVLLYGGGRFLQLLEGDAQAVQDLYDNKIAQDARHTDCRVLLNAPCQARLFPGWSMGRLYLPETQGAAQQSWDALCAEIGRQNPAAVFARVPAVQRINEFIQEFASAFDRPHQTVGRSDA